MSGLFGANAVRSPLSDVPTTKARSAEQLEAIVEAALLPDIFTKARTARRAMHPARPIDGFTHEVDLTELDPSTAANVRDVLNAGATIGAVRREDRPGHYMIRSELYEFLSEIIKRELKANKADATQSLKLNELEDRIAEALVPDIGRGANIVLHYMHAANEKDGFSSIIEFNQVAPENALPVRNVLNVGARFGKVRRYQNDTSRYEVHGDVHSALSSLRARIMMSAAASPQQHGSIDHSAAYGGHLNPSQAEIAPAPAPAALQGPDSVAQKTAPEKDTKQQDRSIEPAKLLERYTREYWYELLSSLGLGTSAGQQIARPGIQEAAVAAWHALTQQAAANAPLRRFLMQHEEVQQSAIGQTYSSLRRAANNDATRLTALDQAESMIQERLGALMLFPDNGLLGYVVDELERAAAPDNGQQPGEQALLDLLRNVKAEMDRADLSDARIWNRVSAAFAAHGQSQGQQAIFHFPRNRAVDGRSS
jgi:hypothetical protein